MGQIFVGERWQYITKLPNAQSADQQAQAQIPILGACYVR